MSNIVFIIKNHEVPLAVYSSFEAAKSACLKMAERILEVNQAKNYIIKERHYRVIILDEDYLEIPFDYRIEEFELDKNSVG